MKTKIEDLEDIIDKGKKKKFRILKGNDPKLIVPRIPFDNPQLDTVLGGGLPLGRTTLVTGDFGTGKTFFSQIAISNFQRRGYSTAYVDTERRFEPEWFNKSGIDLSKLFVAQPASGEDALDMCTFLVQEKVGLVVLDSVAALVPTVELEGVMADSTIASLARLLNKGLRKITELNIASDDLQYRGTSFVMINQIRSGIGLFTSYSLPGGKGQQYFASIILKVMRGSYIEEDGRRVGFNMKLYTDKNNLTAPFQECILPFRFTGIIDSVAGLIELALDMGIIKQAGAYISLGELFDGRIHGKLALAEELKINGELHERLRSRVYNLERKD